MDTWTVPKIEQKPEAKLLYLALIVQTHKNIDKCVLESPVRHFYLQIIPQMDIHALRTQVKATPRNMIFIVNKNRQKKHGSR